MLKYIEAHKESYENALNEIKNGKKESHWMWYIFPQVIGLGESEISEYFAIKSIAEAKNFLNDPYLGNNLRKISQSLMELDTDNAELVFGSIDALKLKSSMTLFSYISNEEIFNQVLDKFYNGEHDDKTIEICEYLSGRVIVKR